MSYQAFYRTYRPQSFSEVVGQKAIIKTLENSLREQKIAHAYLFSGPRGTGKTTMARLFAKSLNCEEGVGHECDHCQNCLAVKSGSHPDVFEIDAASNSGVENVRDLIDQVKYQPILGRYKVYIIDEVHNMSSSAFNALLKTLEEPPANVVFILATTEPQKVLPTILSRVQRFDFTKVSDADIISKMTDILKNEKVRYEPEVLTMIARLAEGGVRDALSILDQVVSYSGSYVKCEDINLLFGLLSVEEKLELVKRIGAKDLTTVLTAVKKLYDRGIDIVRLHDDLIKIYKDLLVFGMTKDENLLTVLKPGEALSTLIKPKDIRQSLTILTESRRDYRKVSNTLDHFELTLIRLCAETEDKSEITSPKPDIPQISAKEIKSTVETDVENVETKPVKSIAKTVNFEGETVPVLKAPDKKAVEVFAFGPALDISPEDIIQVMVQGSKADKQKLLESWSRLKNPMAMVAYGQYAVMLNATTPRIIGAGLLVVETVYEAQVAKINLVANQEGLRRAVAEMFGIQTAVYALTGAEYISLVNRYKNLQQAGKLPTPEPLDFDKILRRDVNDKFIADLKKED